MIHRLIESQVAVGLTLFLFALKLWEFFDLEYEKVYQHLAEIKECMEKNPNDLVLCEAVIAHRTVLKNFDAPRRWLWIWFPGYLVLLLFFLVTMIPNFACKELVSGLELWAVIYFVAVSIPVLGAIWGMRHRPIEKYRKVRKTFPSCFQKEEKHK